MNISPFSLNLLEPIGRILLLGSMGYAIYRVIQGKSETEDAAIACIIGAMGLFFYKDGFSIINSFSDELCNLFKDSIDQRSFKEHLLEAIQKSSIQSQGALPSTGDMMDQLWRSGVWGVVSTLIDLAFMLADLIIVASQKVLSKQVLFFFPIACGLYPVFPKIFFNLSLYAIELSLWRPFLVTIHEIVSIVGKEYIINDQTHGLQILAVELVALFLIISIPSNIHGVMQGALSGDHGISGGFVNASRMVMAKTVGLIRGGA